MSVSVVSQTFFIVSLALAIPAAVLLYIGLVKVCWLARKAHAVDRTVPTPPIEILVPVKGANRIQQDALLSLIIQEYPCHKVTFIVESLLDPASGMIDALCQEFPNTRKLVAGVSSSCAQKNHNLVYGLSNLHPDTEIIVFCDATNCAPPQWLLRFTERLRKRQGEVVTTFRQFSPKPQTIPGVSQALYGVVVLLLVSVVPKPWGGGTAMRRETMEKIPLRETWSQTIVDDLTLGNILGKARIRVHMDSRNLLQSSLSNHSFSAFLKYLDRQILFPKFTNHFIWGTLMGLHVNLAISMPLAALQTITVLLGSQGDLLPYAWVAFLISMVGVAESARRLLNPRITSWRWLLAIVPVLGVGSFLFLRSIFARSITWAGRVYQCGKGGVVTGMEDEASGREGSSNP